MAYGQPMMQTKAATAVEYVQQPPAVEYIQAPAVEYIQQAPMVEYVQPARVVESIQKAPTIVDRAPVAPRNLLAMGNVVSERVISIEELAARDRYTTAEATMVQAPREIVVQQPQVVEYIQPPPVAMAPQMMTTVAPQTVTMAPQTMMAAP